MTTTKTTFKKSFFSPKKNVYVIFCFSCSLYFFLGQVWIQQPFNIKVYSTTFFSVFWETLKKMPRVIYKSFFWSMLQKWLRRGPEKTDPQLNILFCFKKRRGKRG